MKINFKPRLSAEDLEYYLSDFSERQIENDEVYTLIEELINLAYPTYEDQYDKRWEYFYILVKRKRDVIAVPVWIMEYNKEFFGMIESFGNFHVTKGNKDVEDSYKDMFKDILDFVAILKKDEGILKKIIPYDIRTGKIKGQYVIDKEELLPHDKKDNILEKYKKHVEKRLEIRECSLNEYLEIAAICYIAVYQKDTYNISPLEMYRKWADGRDGGLLSIKDWSSREEFYQWYHSGMWTGSHPFEIVFSWHRHGIHLYPPNRDDNDSHFFIIKVTNYAYAKNFIKMVDALIERHIPFEARDIDNVLDFLSGDTYFIVNKRDEYNFTYIPSKEYEKKYFPYIEWDNIKIVKWK